MKSRQSPDESARFQGGVRHYHRASTNPQKTWEEWVDGKAPGIGTSRNWFLIIGAIVGVLVLAGIVAGLIIELR